MALLRLIFLCFLLVFIGQTPGQAEQPAPSPKVEELLQLLGDKDVQEWIQTHNSEAAKTAEAAAQVESGAAVSKRLREIRQHMQDLVHAIPQVPAEIGRAAVKLRAATQGYRFVTIVFLGGSFIILGLLAQWLFRRVVQDFNAMAQRSAATTPRQRVAGLLLRLILGVGSLAAFAVGSFGGFLLFQWPDLLRTIVVTMLIAALALMISRSLLAILFGSSSGAIADHWRLLPMTNDAAGHFRSRLALVVGWYAFGYSFIKVLRLVDMRGEVVELVAYTLGFGLLVIGLEAVWRRPPAETSETTGSDRLARTAEAWSWFYSVAFATMWLLWVAGAMRLFWLLALALGLPLAIRWTRRAVRNVFHLPEAHNGGTPATDIIAVGVEYLLRALLILAGIWILAWAWDIGIRSLADNSDPLVAVAHSVFIVLIVFLVTDLAWQLVKSLIDASLSNAAVPREKGSREAIRSAKLLTLLPIIRNVAIVFFATLAVLMALSTMGIQIAPLIASAGVVGVAIGFGAQTVVKDVISGMFYLMDDAFRMGEYIITGKFKGTVESFSLRSVRLRHHNGPVFTIPFGELGAVENMSRDYVIDKFTLTVTYDSDLEKARKLIKKIGEQLMEDPEVSGSIIEPMKMQRVDQFGDYGIVLKCKMTTRPGEQFMVRTKAFPLIKKLFDESGIKFAFPTVTVAEADHDSKIAAAQQALTIEESKRTTD